MGVCLIYGHWHTPDEVAAGALLGPVVVYVLWRFTEKRGNSVAAGDRL